MNMRNSKRDWISILLSLLASATFALEAGAQSSPSDLTDMSLSELMDLEVQMRTVDDDLSFFDPSRFHLGYTYVRSIFDGYRSGRHRVSNSSLLGPPNGSTYPILQKEIIQQAHLFELTYDVHERVFVNVQVPYIRQSTDHESLVMGFDEFTIKSDGIGDISLTVSGVLYRGDHHSIIAGTGFTIPSGSIRKKGHTPAGPGSQLPYTMQIGSGTWDIPVSLSYRGSSEALPCLGELRWGVSSLAKFRTARNSRGYRLGNRVLISGFVRARPLSWLEPVVKIETQFWGRIHGTDDNFPGPIFPTPVTDPHNFGGTKVSLVVGLRLRAPSLGDGVLAKILGAQAIEADFGRAIYQDLNGPQPEEDWRVSARWTVNF